MKKTYIYAALTTLVIGMFTSCSEDSIPTNYAPIFDNTKNQATDIYRTGAVLQGNIKVTDNTKFDECGIMISEYPDMTKATYKPVVVGTTSAAHSIIANVDGLKSGVTYYYCAYAKSGSTTVMGDINNFTTPSTSGPTIVNTRTSVADDQYTSCNVASEVADNGGTDLFIGGYIYKKVESADDVQDIKFSDPDVMSISNEEAATFNQVIPNLHPNSYYAVRAYGVSYGVGYGEVKVVKTPKNSLPAVSTTTVSDITEDGMYLMADIIDNGTSEVTQRGFCYSTTDKNPTIYDERITNYQSGNEITAFIGDLQPGATYYIRAYAMNNSTEGVGYGEVLELKVTGVKVIVHDTAYVYPNLDNYMTQEQVYALLNDRLYSYMTYYEVQSFINDIKQCTCNPDDLAKLKSQIDAIDKDHRELIGEVYAKVDKLNGELNDSIATLRKMIAANEKTLNGMREYYMKQFEKDSISIESLKSALSWIEGEVKEQQEALKDAQAAINELKTITVDLSARVSKLEDDYSVLAKELNDITDALKTEIDALHKEISAINDKVEKLDYRLTLLEEAVSQMKQSTPMPVIIDSCAIASVTDNALNVKAWIDYKKYADKYNEVFGKNALYGNDYYATLYPIVMAGFVFSTVSPEPTVQNCNKMIVVASPYTKDMTTITASIPLIANASTYYVRAFAINSYGTVYSPAEVFKVGPEGNDNQFPGFNARRIK